MNFVRMGNAIDVAIAKMIDLSLDVEGVAAHKESFTLIARELRDANADLKEQAVAGNRLAGGDNGPAPVDRPEPTPRPPDPGRGPRPTRPLPPPPEPENGSNMGALFSEIVDTSQTLSQLNEILECTVSPEHKTGVIEFKIRLRRRTKT